MTRSMSVYVFQSADQAYQNYYQAMYGQKAGGFAMGPQYLTANVVMYLTSVYIIYEMQFKSVLCNYNVFHRNKTREYFYFCMCGLRSASKRCEPSPGQKRTMGLNLKQIKCTRRTIKRACQTQTTSQHSYTICQNKSIDMRVDTLI